MGKIVCCTHCGEVLSSGFEYATHFLTEHFQKIDEEIQGNSKRRKLDCPICPFTCDETDVLEVHVESFHAEGTSESVLSCFLCGSSVSTQTELERHVEKCLPRPASSHSAEFSCPDCEMQLSKGQELEDHMEKCLEGSYDSKRTQSDHELAVQLQREEDKHSDQREFQKLQVVNSSFGGSSRILSIVSTVL